MDNNRLTFNEVNIGDVLCEISYGTGQYASFYKVAAKKGKSTLVLTPMTNKYSYFYAGGTDGTAVPDKEESDRSISVRFSKNGRKITACRCGTGLEKWDGTPIEWHNYS